MEDKKLVLQASDVSIMFGGLCAVNGFSCELYQGELVGLIGPNGAGKTTMFNMISGIYTPTSGEINFWDKKDRVHMINNASPAKLNKMGIARTFQNIRLFGNLSVMDNVKIALHGSRVANPLDVLFRTPRFQKDEQLMTDKVMHLLQLFKIEHKKDELAKNLPYDVTILLIEHDMKLVMGICEKILVLDYGRVIASGKPEEIRANPQVIKAYLGGEVNL